jgi:hypothetical protein
MYAVFDVSLNGVFSRRTHAWCFFAGGFVLTRLDFRYNKTEQCGDRRHIARISKSEMAREYRSRRQLLPRTAAAAAAPLLPLNLSGSIER